VPRGLRGVRGDAQGHNLHLCGFPGLCNNPHNPGNLQGQDGYGMGLLPVQPVFPVPVVKHHMGYLLRIHKVDSVRAG